MSLLYITLKSHADDGETKMSNKFPMDLITDIFCRLPAKTLVRFNCLSKPCSSLIDSPDFVHSHLARSYATKSNLNLILKSLHLYTVDFDSLAAAAPLEHPADVGGPTEAFGTCDGLIGLRYSDTNVAVFNPSTRRLRKLPVSPIDRPTGESCKSGYVFYGFGKDLTTLDYKVVRMVQFREGTADELDDEDCPFEYEVKVYSLKSHSWKKIERQPRYLRFLFQFFYHLLHRRGYGVLANGVLHWIMPPRVELVELDHKIVGFDLSSEEFIEVPQPEYSNRNFLMDVGVLEGNLCAVCNYNQAYVDLWVMKEHGVKGSWTKLLSIQSPRSIESFSFLRPLAYSKERDRILLEINSQRLVWYNIETKKLRTVRIRDAPDAINSEIYVGSLIPVEKTERSEVKKQVEQVERNKCVRKTRDDFLSHGFKLVL